jgi:putative ABC transport system permease protein
MLNFLLETCRLGVKNLHLHKLRSFLTTLGIIFGVASVIIMVAIGQGAKRAALDQIKQLGATNILVRSKRPPESNEASSRTQRVLDYGVKRADLAKLQVLLEDDGRTKNGLLKVVPLRDTEQKVVIGDLRVDAHAIGTTPDLFDVINLRLDKGRYFTRLECDRGEAVCVLGAGAARDLFPFQDPLNQKVQVGGGGSGVAILTVVGVLDPTGLRAGSEGASMMQRDLDQDIYFPLPLAQDTFGDAIVKRQSGSFERRQVELSEVWLQARRMEDVESISKIAENLMGLSHRNLADVEIKAPIQILRNAERLQHTFNLVLVTLAGVSLVVGGIGIMNIMLATVTERTREIGIRRALGAKQRHITFQFLVETTVISLAGGMVGIALGVGVATVLPMLVNNYQTAITSWSVIASFSVSGAVGIGFGLYPAIVAARKNPIESLRHE